jgi:hypothetical protein
MWTVARKFAGNHESEQSRTDKSLLDRRHRFRRCRDLRIFCNQLTPGTRILLAPMLQALEMTWDVFDLPALRYRSLAAVHGSTSSFVVLQGVDVRADREMVEIR